MESFPERFNMAEYFLDRRIAEGRGDRVALYVHGGETLTYSDVFHASNRAASAFSSRGVGIEDRVLIVLPDSAEFVSAWFGTLKVGGVFTMVNPRLKPKDYEYYLEYTRAKLLVTTAEVYATIGEQIAGAKHLEHVLVVGDGVAEEMDYHAALRAGSPEFETVDTHRNDFAGWLFTSGSTGNPKAVVHMHHDFPWNTERYAKQVLGIREDDITLGVPKLYFGYATGTNLMFPFSVGAAAVLFDGASKAPLLFDLIEQYSPTILTSVPTMIGAMLAEPGAAERDLSSLRMCLSAGEALPAELYERWVGTFDVEILDGIGSAEMFHIYISNYPGDVKLGSLGRLVPGYETRIVDEAGNDVAAGDVGTLWVKGDSAGVYYWQDHEKSKATFAGDWVKSSDQFRLDADGYYWYCGRADDLLKVGGIFVSPIEVENALLSHPCVRECAVVGYEEGGLSKPLGVIVLNSGFEASDEQASSLQGHVRDQLAHYKYPRKIAFVGELPKNDRGKLNRKELKRQVAEGEIG